MVGGRGRRPVKRAGGRPVTLALMMMMMMVNVMMIVTKENVSESVVCPGTNTLP